MWCCVVNATVILVTVNVALFLRMARMVLRENEIVGYDVGQKKAAI